jgi:hypothetical protein
MAKTNSTRRQAGSPQSPKTRRRELIPRNDLEPVRNRLLGSITTLEVLDIAMQSDESSPLLEFQMTLAKVLRELHEHHDAIDRLILGQPAYGANGREAGRP